MIHPRRVGRLYIKDLLDILRDRRTLITLIVVPIVLYPGLMLCFIQLGSIQADQMKAQQVVIGVEQEFVGHWLNDMLDRERRAAEADPEALAAGAGIRDWRVIQVEGPLEAWLQRGSGHCGVRLMPDSATWPSAMRAQGQLRVALLSDTAVIRSEMAADALGGVMRRDGRFRLERQGAPAHLLEPIVITAIDVATAAKRGGSMLGQILPLVLVLMTITGAIYPAIDLTAGERERGTLETLIVCPIPVAEIMTGKFLVVVTVSLLGAALNLISMGLTLHFVGFTQALATEGETAVPVAALPVILLCLIPLSVLFSAILLAVASFARSFKEAQSYVTPVIMGALMPAGIAALPGTELQGLTTVLPVANMVLLTRELLLGAVGLGTVAVILLSTLLYASAAVAIAARIFGQEAVLFADAGSWRAQFTRRLIKPASQPKPTMALLIVALLFPIWFYLQNAVQLYGTTDFQWGLVWMQSLMVALFVIVPLACVVYYRVNVRNAFNWHRPRWRDGGAALCCGLSTWVLVHELIIFQKDLQWFGFNPNVVEAVAQFDQGLATLPVGLALLLLALIPALCEEFLFRGLLLSGLRGILRRGWAVLTVGAIFAMYHYLLQRAVVTFTLGCLLAWLGWQSRSLVIPIVVHLLHNGLTVLAALPAMRPRLQAWLRIPASDGGGEPQHYPPHLWIPAVVLVVVGLVLSRPSRPQVNPRS